MEKVTLYCPGRQAGEICLTPQGARTEIRASLPDPGDGLYRAFLQGERGELPLGVLAPEGRRSFRFQDAPAAPCWQQTGCPAGLFRGRFLRERLKNTGRAWWRREKENLLLALPLEPGRPFPLETLFCLGRIERVEGVRCVVYAFREETPVLP